MRKLLPTVFLSFTGTSAVLFLVMVLGGVQSQLNNMQLLAMAPFIGVGMVTIVNYFLQRDRQENS